MTTYLNQAIEIQTVRNQSAKEGNKEMVRTQEKKMAKLFQDAKAEGVNTIELNNQLVNYTAPTF